MKILYVTAEPPSNYSGGGIAVKQSILSLKDLGYIHYIGPKSNDFEIFNYVDEIDYLLSEKSFLIKIKNLTSGVTSSFYNSWKRISSAINWEDYDLVFLEFSKFNFVVKDAKKNNKKVLLRLHNIEYEYSKNLFNIEKSIGNLLKLIFAKFKEEYIIKNSDFIVALTEKDVKSIEDLYKINLNEKKILVNPICLEERAGSSNLQQKLDFTVLITGSLWYGPNYEGIKWFIKNVWTKFLETKFQLIIAGSNPNKELKQIIEKYKNIRLISNPDDITYFFKSADLYIAPIFKGAGMKVKVAEALSFGLPVIGTSHAFIGYKIKDGQTGFIADSSKEFIDKINAYFKLDLESKRVIRENIRNLFLQNYSIKSSQKFFKQLFEDLKKQ